MTVMDTVREGRADSEYTTTPSGYRFPNHLPRIICKDGFSLSVQVGSALYSTPRADEGPWSHVEVGYPSARPEPWDVWQTFCEDDGRPTDTVYAWVPVELVAALVEAHGGEL